MAVFDVDRRVLSLALVGDLATGGESRAQLSIFPMSFGFGVATGPLMSGDLVRYGFVVPFAFGATLTIIEIVFVYTSREDGQRWRDTR